MQYGLMTQIALLIIAVIIIFSYIRPTFAEIGALQDDLYSYTEAVERAEEFNQLISSLVQEIESIPARDRAALQMYMPTSIDSLQVVADIKSMASRSNVLLESAEGTDEEAASEVTTSEVTASEVVTNNSTIEDNAENNANLQQTKYQDFAMSVVGSYEDFVNFLRRIERNAYPLEVVSLELSAPSDEIMSYQLTVRAYALNTSDE